MAVVTISVPLIAVRVPTEVIFACAAVANVPVKVPVTVKLSATVTSEVVCPIVTAIPEVSVAILRAPTALVI